MLINNAIRYIGNAKENVSLASFIEYFEPMGGALWAMLLAQGLVMYDETLHDIQLTNKGEQYLEDTI